MKRFLLALVATVFAAGCLQDSGKDDDRGPKRFREAFFPMAVGNRWTYADTLFLFGQGASASDTDTVATVFATRILSYREDASGDVWWRFLTTGGFLAPAEIRRDTFELMQRSDTVFQVMSLADAPTIAFIRPADQAASFNVPQGSGTVFVGVNGPGPNDTSRALVQNFIFRATSGAQLSCDQVVVPGVGLTRWTEVARLSPETEKVSLRKVVLVSSELFR